MGLIQRQIEAAGIATVGMSNMRRFTEQVKPPRTVYWQSPMGHSLGAAHNVAQQQEILKAVLQALTTIRVPGTIVDLPMAWTPPASPFIRI